MKHGLKKFKQKGIKSGNCRTRTDPEERRIPTSENREPNRKIGARVYRPAYVSKRKARQVYKGI